MMRLCYFPITQKLSLLFVIANGFIIIQTFIRTVSKIYYIIIIIILLTMYIK